MMYDEEYYLKIKYQNLLNRLNQIKKELDTTNSVFKDLYNLSKNTVKINNQCMENDSFTEIKELGSSTISSINGTISSIHSKL